jgi:hypothetical protein
MKKEAAAEVGVMTWVAHEAEEVVAYGEVVACE